MRVLAGLLTTCVLVTDDSLDCSIRLNGARAEGLRVISVAATAEIADAIGARTADAIRPPADDLDPTALYGLALAAVTTPWALLAVAGERIEILDGTTLATLLETADAPALPVHRVAVQALAPDPVTCADLRLVRRDHEVRWALPAAGEAGEVRRAPIIVATPKRFPGKQPEAGWLRAVMSRRARDELAHGSANPLIDAATLAWCGEHDAAVIRAARLARSGDGHTGLLAARVHLASSLATGRTRDVKAAAESVLAFPEAGNNERAWVALAGAVLRQPELGRRALEPTSSGQATPRREPYEVDPWLHAALAGLTQTAQARSELEIGLLREVLAATSSGDPEAPVAAQRLVGSWYAAGREPHDLVRTWPDNARELLRDALETGPRPDIRFWARAALSYVDSFGLTPKITARVAAISTALDHEDALAWTARLRKNGNSELSPLLLRATAPSLSPMDRLVSAALALELFDDRAAVPLLRTAAELVPAAELRRLIVTLDEVASSTLPAVIEAAAHTPGRAHHLADLLAEFGADDIAEGLRRHAARLDAGRHG